MNDSVRQDSLPIVLKVQGLSFAYPGRYLFSDWTHEFVQGITWVQGPNGCGKSTLLKLLGGALNPISGHVAIGTIQAGHEPLAYRQAVFYCGPGPISFDHLSPSEYFGFMRSLYPAIDEEGLAQHVEGFGLHPFLNVPLALLSTGTQRKAWLAMALAAGTRVTLIDEPFNALDVKSLTYLRLALHRCANALSSAWIVASHEDPGAPASHRAILELAAPSP